MEENRLVQDFLDNMKINETYSDGEDVGAKKYVENRPKNPIEEETKADAVGPQADILSAIS